MQKTAVLHSIRQAIGMDLGEMFDSFNSFDIIMIIEQTKINTYPT